MDFDQVIDSALGCLGAPEVVPDAILPAQFFPGTAARGPERRLMMAVLARALLDLQRDAAAVRSHLGPWRQGAQWKVVRLPIPAVDETARLARTG